MSEAATRARPVPLVEVLLLYVALAVVLWLAVGVSNYVQREAKQRQATDMVLTLREAVLAYREEAGRFPTGDVDTAITAMLAKEVSQRILRDWPGGARANGKSVLVDPWGRPFRYLTVQNGPGEYEERVLADGGVPIFESAGADGSFGDPQAGELEDNLASDIAAMIMIDEQP